MELGEKPGQTDHNVWLCQETYPGKVKAAGAVIRVRSWAWASSTHTSQPGITRVLLKLPGWSTISRESSGGNWELKPFSHLKK